MKTYTIGELYRLKLLINYKGEPYKDKATVSKVVNKMEFMEEITPWGVAKTITKKQIKEHNSKFNS